MIKYYNRKTKEYEIEKVAGEKYLDWIYSSPVGMGVLEAFVKKKLFSELYGHYCDMKLSKRKVPSFIKDLDIDMSVCNNTINDFKCFNDFFTRTLKSDARPVCMDASNLISPGDGRLMAYENIDIDNIIQVKGLSYSLKELLQNDEIAQRYSGGTYIILRLCPTDYHRFHFIDCGICSKTVKISGSYYSVNPAALSKVQKLFCQNKREWSILSSENFGNVLYIEVGATCVGSIIQSYTPGTKVNKGDEKGYFKFGGSTLILLFEKNKIAVDSDIIKQTKQGFECKVLMGEKIGIQSCG